MKEEALKLAKIFEDVNRAKYPYHLDAADMIRKLVEELDKQTYKADLLENRLKIIVGSKPLSDDEINEIAMYCSDMNEYGHSKLDEFAFARAIEERHGIK